jgi:hypothetical protein
LLALIVINYNNIFASIIASIPKIVKKRTLFLFSNRKPNNKIVIKKVGKNITQGGNAHNSNVSGKSPANCKLKQNEKKKRKKEIKKKHKNSNIKK